MTPKPDIKALKRRIANQERVAPQGRPVVSLGAALIDNALPDNGLEINALHEFLPASHTEFAATVGFSFGLVARLARMRSGPVLWVLPSFQAFRQGALYPVGLAAAGFDADRLIQVTAPKPQDALWALEEGLASSAPAAVVGVLPENERVYDFTASRRLALRAVENGVSVFLIRNPPTSETATAAETRWSVAAASSAGERRTGLSTPGVGAPRWALELVKCKRGMPHRWEVEWDHETLCFRLAAPVADRAPEAARLGREQDWAVAS